MIPSRVLASGVNSMTTAAIRGIGGEGLTATGSSSADALELTADYNQFSTVAASTGAMLPDCEAGAVIAVANDGASALTVYPDAAATIDGGASYSVAAGGHVLFVAFSNTTWYSFLGA